MDNQRLPSLDGLRAISICFVLLAHLDMSHTTHLTDHLWRFDFGNLGVRIFFVISGFLITSLLLAERRKAGAINLPAFYLRRFLRIMPAYWVLLACVAILSANGLASVRDGDLVAAFLYISNYVSLDVAVGHTWSLSVEEQFYLAWPMTLVALSERRAGFVIALLLAASPVLRAIATLSGSWPSNPAFAFELVCDSLATGCGLALLRSWLWNQALYRRTIESKAFYLLPGIAVILQAAQLPAIVWTVVVAPLLNFSIAMTIDKVIRQHDSGFGRFLNTKPLVAIGTLSYSIYLWQQLFMDPKHPIVFPVNLACVLVAAIISYLVVERPILAMRQRMRRSGYRLSYLAAEKKGASIDA